MEKKISIVSLKNYLNLFHFYKTRLKSFLKALTFFTFFKQERLIFIIKGVVER